MNGDSKFIGDHLGFLSRWEELERQGAAKAAAMFPSGWWLVSPIVVARWHIGGHGSYPKGRAGLAHEIRELGVCLRCAGCIRMTRRSRRLRSPRLRRVGEGGKLASPFVNEIEGKRRQLALEVFIEANSKFLGMTDIQFNGFLDVLGWYIGGSADDVDGLIGVPDKDEGTLTVYWIKG